MPSWLESPPGRYLLDQEQAQLDRMVFDIFGYHAVQLGWPAVQGLRTNRMPHRWLVCDADTPTLESSLALPPPPSGMAARPLTLSVLCESVALPFPSESLDLVLLPHALELAADPHQTLREVERVLRPEGRVIVIGFNPASLWGLRRRFDRMLRPLGGTQGFLPHDGELIGLLRLRDWLRLLGLEIEIGHFGCYRPAFSSGIWLERTAWMEQAGQRWWSVFGAVYFVVAVKRVRGMRLIGPAWKRRKHQGSAAPVLTQSRQSPSSQSSD